MFHVPMRRLVAALAITAALLAFHSAAYAQCVTNGFMDGLRYRVCTTCCYSGVCNTVCS